MLKYDKLHFTHLQKFPVSVEKWELINGLNVIALMDGVNYLKYLQKQIKENKMDMFCLFINKKESNCILKQRYLSDRR